MESEHVKGSNIEHAPKNPEVKQEEDETPFIEGKTREVSTPPPLKLHSDDDDDEKSPPPNSSVKPESDGNPQSPPEVDSSPDATTPSPEPPEMKSPPIQTMGHPPGYDPNRIPTSIFSTKTGNPTDWSATSNESLFSIHMGNNSFSRDYAILFGKSGEIPKFEDSNSPQSNPFSMSEDLPRLDNRHVSAPGGLPALTEVPSQEERNVASGELSRIEKKDDNISPKIASGQPKENHGKENYVSGEATKKPRLPEPNHSSPRLSMPSPSRFSDASGHSASSFAFPVLASDSGKNDSLKVALEKPEKPGRAGQPEVKNQAQVSATNGSGSRWFSCFSCWPPRFCCI